MDTNIIKVNQSKPVTRNVTSPIAYKASPMLPNTSDQIGFVLNETDNLRQVKQVTQKDMVQNEFDLDDDIEDLKREDSVRINSPMQPNREARINLSDKNKNLLNKRDELIEGQYVTVVDKNVTGPF